MVDALMKGPRSLDRNWSETGLPQLVDRIMNNYEALGGMDHLEGKDLPSKKVVIEVLEDLLTIFFPGYLGKTEITKTNIKYFLGNTLTSVQTRLTEEVEKSL
jgi:serine O-acetyltransferase